MLEINGKILCASCFAEQTADSRICGACGYDADAVAENSGTLPVGMLLHDKYYIGKTLGRGGFGITYLAYNKSELQIAALKEYFPDSLSYRAPDAVTVSNYSGDKETHYKSGVERFYNEAKILSRFNGNDHIVNVTDFFYANNTAYYVMEYVNGVDLKKYIAMRGGRLPYDEALDILVPVTYALIIVHSIDVLHRDISPDNIYLTKEGEIKLLDFGAARQIYGEQSNSLSVILKQGFTPIEQYRRRGHHGPWSDVYALGATIYYALTGQIPEESVNRLENDELPMPSEMGIPVPADFEVILRKMLAVKAEDRYQSMIELKEAMRSLGNAPDIRSAPGGAPGKQGGAPGMQGAPGRQASAPTGPDAAGKPFPIVPVAGGAGALVLIIILVIYLLTPRGAKAVAGKEYTLITSAFRIDCNYSGDWLNDAPNGSGVLTILEEAPNYWAEGSKITGSFVDGLVQGDGKYEEPDGDAYTGGFKNGLRSGQGTLTLKNGETYIGDYKNHFLNGKGTVIYADGGVYEGNFTDGVIDGAGKYRYPDGGIYEGDFKGGLGDGFGKYNYPNGGVYEGEYSEGVISGHGKYTYPDGGVYEGEFAGAKENGEGIFTSPDGWRYEGAFEDGSFHGEGVSYDADGNVIYEGLWENGKPAGPAPEQTPELPEEVTDERYTLVTSLFTAPCLYTGEWENGMPNGLGELVIEETGSNDTNSWFKGDAYAGSFTDGLLEGMGTYMSESGDWYEGEFKKGLYNGAGTYHAVSEGYTYAGDFIDEVCEGYGVLTWDDGYKYEGDFSGGNIHGEGTLYDGDGNIVYSGTWVQGEQAEG